MCSYVRYVSDWQPQKRSTAAEDDASGLPARYRTRGGKRRKTTIAKREKSLKLERQRSQEFTNGESSSQGHWHPRSGEEKYKISSDSNSSVDEDYEVDSIASSIEESLTWRGRMQVALHSSWIHGIIVALVVADALIVIFELLLDVGAFGNLQCEGETPFDQKKFCHYKRPDHCGPYAEQILDRLNISASPGMGVGMDGLCTCKFRGGRRVCDGKDEDLGVSPALVLHVASLFILTLFVVEIVLKLITFRLKYFTHRFEVFDGIIVFLSYILDWASLQEEEAFEAASLVIILRLWRVVRIVNGAILSSKSRSDQQLSEARLKARMIIHSFHKAQDKMDSLEEENRSLKRKLAHGKAVHVPRGSYDTQVQLTEKQAVDSQDSTPAATQQGTVDEKPGPMPDIVVTEPAKDDGSDM
jgi:hypothetical protein